MITKLYVDNYRTLGNFDLALKPVNLLLGPNGSGKSSVFEVIRSLQDFVIGKEVLADVFPATTLARWDKRTVQIFELVEKHESNEFRYHLEVEHVPDQKLVRVKNEEVSLDGNPLFRFQLGDVQLYRDNSSPGPHFSFDWTQSAFATLVPRPDNKHASGFRSRLAKLLVAKLNPATMRAEAEKEESRLHLDLSNFVAWYRWLSQEHQDIVLDLTQKLRADIEGFHSFALRGEDRKILSVKFGAGTGDSQTYRFDELSDGQRVLFALHVLKEAARRLGFALWLDEPENFLSLREIQPWLGELYDAVEESSIPQAVLVSHHPVLINYLARSNGIWFDRGIEQPTRVRAIEITDLQTASERGGQSAGLTVAELVERGWLYE